MSGRRLVTKWMKTRCCVGRLCADIRLKCKNKFTIKKVLSLPIINFRPFGADSISNMAIRRSTKDHKGSWHWGLLSERIVTRHTSDKFKDRWWFINPHHNQRTTQPSLRYFHYKTNNAHCLPTHAIPPCQKQKKKTKQKKNS